MKAALKKYFIPHAKNNFHPHLLHQKRLMFYGLFGVSLKLFTVLLIMILPAHALLGPEDLEKERLKIIEMTNSLRKTPVHEDSLLNRSAALKTKDMIANRYFAHVGPSNRNLHFFLAQAKYPYQVAGENLAMGFFSAKAVMEAWKKSPTHYANLIDPTFEDIGVSIVPGDHKGIPTVYIAEHFGHSSKSPFRRSRQRVLGQRITQEDPSGNFPLAEEELNQVQVPPTGFTKYQQIKQVFGRFKAFFMVPSITFILLFTIFSIALLLSLFVEIKKPRPHVLWQTMGLLFLIAFLFVI